MLTRGVRWLSILVAFGVSVGIPILIMSTAQREKSPRVDVAFPPSCDALFSRVVVGPTDKALDEARTLASSKDATVEERSCATQVAAALAAGQPDARRLRVAALPSPCSAPDAAAEAGHLREARKQLEAVERSTAPAVVQGCAAGALARLPHEQTLADWTFTESNRLAADLTRPLPGGPLDFSQGTKPIVVGAVWLVTLVAFLTGIRQVLRLCRERIPGPVKVADVAGASDAPSGAALANLLRQRLADTGIYPDPTVTGVGELAVDVGAILDVASSSARFAAVIKALKSVLSVAVGYNLTSTIDRGAGAGAEAGGGAGMVEIQVQLADASTGGTVALERYTGTDEREAVTSAAYHLYLWLSRLPEVLRRTPPFLRWQSVDGLFCYQRALEQTRLGSFLGAVDHLKRAAELEPRNLLVALQLSDVNLSLGDGTPTDVALRANWEFGDWYLDALVAALRALFLNPDSSEAQSQVALTLSRVRHWRDRWTGHPRRATVVTLLHQVDPWVDRHVAMAGAPTTLGDLDPKGDSFEVVMLDLARRRWSNARRRTWWPWILWVAIRLDRRRTVQAQLWPLRRGRHRVHDMVLASEVATRYDLLGLTLRRTGPHGAGARHRRQERWAGFLLLKLRLVGRWQWMRRPAAGERSVQYNLAAAYARQAVYLHQTKDAAGATRARRRAVACLRSAFTGPGTETGVVAGSGGFGLQATDFDSVLSDSALAELRTAPEFMEWFASFDEPDALDVARGAWRGVYLTLAQRAAAVAFDWVERLATAPGGPAWDDAGRQRGETIAAWLAGEARRWRTLSDWVANPAGTKARRDFEDATSTMSTKSPLLEPVGATVQVRGCFAPDVEEMRNQNLEAMQEFQRLADEHAARASEHLRRAVDFLAARNLAGIESLLAEQGPQFRAAWIEVGQLTVRR